MRIIRLKEVIDSTGLARSTIYKYIAENTFPKPVSLGDRCVGWVDSEVHDWILARVEERDQAEAAPVRVSRLGVAV
jgi:prophage regulatory protein